MNLDPEELKAQLLEAWDYKPTQVDETVGKLLRLDAQILEAFRAWDGSLPLPAQPLIHGYTPRSLSQAFKLKPPACFLLLDWILRQPSAAMTALMTEYGQAALEIRIQPDKPASPAAQEGD